MTPEQQAYEECSKICNEQLQASNGTIKWAKAVEMCQRLMTIAWLRGYAVKIENSDPAPISDADSPALNDLSAPLLPSEYHEDCDCMTCRPWTT